MSTHTWLGFVCATLQRKQLSELRAHLQLFSLFLNLQRLSIRLKNSLCSSPCSSLICYWSKLLLRLEVVLFVVVQFLLHVTCLLYCIIALIPKHVSSFGRVAKNDWTRENVSKQYPLPLAQVSNPVEGKDRTDGCKINKKNMLSINGMIITK